jgi:signal transduction histidine kinase
MSETPAVPGDEPVEGAARSAEDAATALVVLIARAHRHSLSNRIDLLRLQMRMVLEEVPSGTDLEQEIQQLLEYVDALDEDVRAVNLRAEAALQPVEIDKEIERLANEFSQASLMFDFDWQCDAPGTIVNAPGLPYVLRELLWNFLKFATPVAAGNERRRVSLKSSTSGRLGWVRISISGPGADAGMTDDFIERMFNRGFSTDETSGGEGLWLGKVLMNHAGGELAAHSSVPEGLLFTIDLPIGGRR